MLGQAALLSCVLLGPSGGGARAEQDPESDPKLKGITALHNEARRDALPRPATPLPPLVWDEKLAKSAGDWASRCVYKHSGKEDVGENIYASAGADTKPADVVANWRAERAHYKYKSSSCARGKTCGHYTQVVWRDSQRLGCAAKSCTKGSPFGAGFPTWQFWVCNYDPRGNINGERPY
jgi:uncharacterized protein YkwD